MTDAKNRSETLESPTGSAHCLSLLSSLLFGSNDNKESHLSAEQAANYGRDDLGQIWALANSHHVIMRTFPALHRIMTIAGNSRSDWGESAVRAERERIHHALDFLAPICEQLESVGEVIVIKSLDHWPDLGSDLDLYTTAKGAEVVSVMRDRFRARLAERSWGDRIANKWNFIVPGLSELVEVHVNRLGQTGEQVAITDSLVARSTREQFGSHLFRVPSAEDRVIISTLQRMYRHFYVRLCDIANVARHMDIKALDYAYLESVARPVGLWDGLASYLVLVSEYVEQYRGQSPALPPSVRASSGFSGVKLRLKQRFLRIPIFPQAANLYAKEWAKLLFSGELENTMRLSLLPGLAVAAAVAFKATGSDKGIW